MQSESFRSRAKRCGVAQRGVNRCGAIQPIGDIMSHGPHKCLGLDGRADGRFDRYCVEWGGHKGHCARWDAVGYDICKVCILNEDGVCYS